MVKSGGFGLLELERGEDLDLQRQLHDQDSETRLLQQLKRRPANLTLRTPAALEALATFCEHQQLKSARST
jgi:hypothetical protein